MILIEILLGGLAVLLLVPVSVLLVQVVSALPARREQPLPAGKRPRVTVLVPAHDEAAVIADTLATVKPQLLEGDRLLVVADHCSDDTAGIARTAGAEVVERRDEERRGKGYALDFGMRRLEASPPEVVIVVDADCEMETGSIDNLARLCAHSGRPIQALYLMRAPEAAGLKARLAEFAWLVKNQVRPLGFLRLDLPCQLMGTGMAIPWQLAATMHLANANLVEDMKLGVDLALAGYPPLFCPQARVTSVFPSGALATETQRTRWEHGHLNMILRELPRLIAHAFAKRDLGVLAMALDLVVPPLALLVILLVMLVTLNAAAAGVGMSVTPLALTALALGMMVTAILLAWRGWGRQIVSLSDLLSMPIYVLAKIPLYIKYITHRQKEWVRTKRE